MIGGDTGLAGHVCPVSTGSLLILVDLMKRAGWSRVVILGLESGRMYFTDL